jgi:hypothetical protein
MMGGPGMGSMGSQLGSGLARNTMMAGVPGYGMDFGAYAPGMLELLGLTQGQRAAIYAINEDLWGAEWDVMGDMQALMWNTLGPAGQGVGYDEMIVLRREMLAPGRGADSHRRRAHARATRSAAAVGELPAVGRPDLRERWAVAGDPDAGRERHPHPGEVAGVPVCTPSPMPGTPMLRYAPP